MRLFLGVCCLCSALVFAQPADKARAAPQAAENLKLLSPGAGLMQAMQDFNQSLGVQCQYCHESGDFASDRNPRKETARKMIAMVREIATFFPSSTAVFPAGYHEVDCSTCHRGSTQVETQARQHFMNRGDAAGRVPPKDKATNLRVLPANTEVHGKGTIMEDFRDALLVDCAYCHSGGGTGWAKDDNPRKEIARQMILMTRQTNANFPGTGVYPAAPQKVSCYSCHRGETHPLSGGNKNFAAPTGQR
jgi:Photosynthetic reaction centre cytochrome C subunit